MKRNFPGRFLLFLLVPLGPLLVRGAAAPTDGFQTLEMTVDGFARSALVYVPTGVPSGTALPVVFAFHGHGGSARGAVGTFGLNRQWPGAISVYPQGLDTPGMLSDPQGRRSGWQSALGGQGGRDLHFFDALLVKLKASYPVDTKRIYVTGHSNGGGFTYMLWLARPQVFAAVAPSSAAALYALQLTPKPAMILAGQNDPLVRFEWQERMIDAVRRVNGCEAGTGQPWAEGAGTLFPSKGGTPLVTFVYPGGHAMDPGEPALITKFFQEHFLGE